MSDLLDRENVTQHDAVWSMYEKIHNDGITNVADRFAEQEKIRCKAFCEKGLSCQICSQGPCRIIPGKVERGVCGIDADAMAMRNLLHKDNMGIANYTNHCKDAANTLKATAQGKTPYSIKDPSKIDLLAGALGIKSDGDINKKAALVAAKVLKSLSQPSEKQSIMVKAFAPEPRQKLWKKLGIFPGGPYQEIADSVARSMTNIDGDYVSLALSMLRLGVASCYGSLVPLELIQDALFGTPAPHEAYVDLGVLDASFINILPNGHEPFVGAAIIEAAHSPEAQKIATDAGASGIHVVGSIETGQELMQRFECDSVFAGTTGNWLNQEYALATGTVDAFVMDNSCSPPNLGEVAAKYGATLIAVGKTVGVPGTKHRIIYNPAKVKNQAMKIIKIAAKNFKARKGNGSVSGLKKTKIMTGFSAEAIVGALGGSLDPLLDVIKSGAIKGITALVSCTTLRDGGQDITTVAVAKELIKRDILVLSAGCGNGACQVGGLTSVEAQELAGDNLKGVCKQLGIPPVLSFGTCTDTGRIALLVGAVAEALGGLDTPQLPIAVTAPEYMEQKAAIAAASAVALGLYTHVSPLPPVGGAPRLVKLLTEDVEEIIGGKLAVETTTIEAVDGIEKHIEKKRKALGI